VFQVSQVRCFKPSASSAVLQFQVERSTGIAARGNESSGGAAQRAPIACRVLSSVVSNLTMNTCDRAPIIRYSPSAHNAKLKINQQTYNMNSRPSARKTVDNGSISKLSPQPSLDDFQMS